jgi:hypothetical protein
MWHNPKGSSTISTSLNRHRRRLSALRGGDVVDTPERSKSLLKPLCPHDLDCAFAPTPFHLEGFHATPSPANERSTDYQRSIINNPPQAAHYLFISSNHTPCPEPRLKPVAASSLHSGLRELIFLPEAAVNAC